MVGITHCRAIDVQKRLEVDIKKIFGYTAYLIIFSVILLIVLEFIVRGVFPQINYQGIQKSMFVEKKFHKTIGLKPNSSGKFFGKKFYTDNYGFRKIHNIPLNYDKSWLFLGDSVTFGLGVSTEKTFAQLIQNEFQDKRILNSAVVGYSTINYLDIVNTFLPEHNDIEKVVLFFTLNDITDNLSLRPKNFFVKNSLDFLKVNSKLYLLLKNKLFDRSRKYALYDIGLYKEDNLNTQKYLNAIIGIKVKLDELNIDFLVVILPYEYQLRTNGFKNPQVLLKNFFAKNNINSLDLYNDFSLLDSKYYFLFGDPMHLSETGHEIAAKKLIALLNEKT